MKRIFFGVLTFTAVCVCLSGPVCAQSLTPPDWKEGFRAHDKNRDGKIDRAEFQEWMVDVFFLRDRGHKGYLVYDDVKDAMSAERFKSQDKSGDGKVRLQEFLNALFQDFAAADVNQDGVLTTEEVAVYIGKAGK